MQHTSLKLSPSGATAFLELIKYSNNPKPKKKTMMVELYKTISVMRSSILKTLKTDNINKINDKTINIIAVRTNIISIQFTFTNCSTGTATLL